MIQIIQGDCRDVLKTLPDESVHCVVTSPPYWGLRDYGVEGQLGLEKTPEEYVAKMVAVFREVRRVLREDGTLFLNMGDGYASQGGPIKEGGGINDILGGKPEWQDYNRSRKAPSGLKPKDLVGMPWMLAFALRSDGWWLRQDIIWAKPNPMPESVTDRCTKAHEYLFLLSKSARYFFDAEAIKEESARPGDFQVTTKTDGLGDGYDGHRTRKGLLRGIEVGPTRNRRSVWTINSEPYPESHFATFPTALVKPCILAGTSAKGCCPKCGAPWERVVENGYDETDRKPAPNKGRIGAMGERAANMTRDGFVPNREKLTTTTGWRPTCQHGEDPSETRSPIPCTVLDPFGGSGTVGQVALELGRKAILIELNPSYVKLAEKRTNVTPGLQLA